jgi:hypothetical protein
MAVSSAQRPPEWSDEIADRIIAVGEWDLLFDDLELTGCELGVDGRLRVLGLLGRLAAVGADLSDPEFLQAHLAPIVATGPEKTAEVAEVIGRWTAQAPSGGAGWHRRLAQQAQPDAVQVVLQADRRSRGWLILGVAVMVIVLLAWAMGWFHLISPKGPGPTAAQPQVSLPIDVGGDWQTRLQDIALRLVFALPVMFFGLLLAGWRKAAGDRLVRRAGNADWSELFTLAAERVRWFAASDARRLFEALKRKLYTLTDRIDVLASVQATLRAGMSPDVRYQIAEERSNYVVLVDRRGAGDHVELLLRSLTADLAAAKIRFGLYEFRGRPAFCTSRSGDRGDAALQFTIIAKRHAGERLLVISDGEGLFEPPGWRALPRRQRIFVRPGTPVAEMGRLRDFGQAVLLTPTPRPAWGQREQMLRGLGFLVVPSDADGINLIGQYIARGGEEFSGSEAASATDDPFISNLSAHALRYASNIPPPPEEIANLVNDLRIWVARTVPDDPLRPGRGFLVLCGVAAFPTIAPGLTLQIAYVLSRSRGGEEAPIDSGILAPLARLPWLRDGHMPEWLRIALLNSLSEEEFEKIRKLQLAVLAEAQPAAGPIDVAGLDRIATAFEVAVGKPVRELDEAAARIAPSAPGEEIERIFLAVLRGQRLDPVLDVISPEAPEVIRERLAAPERRRRMIWIAATVAVAAAVAFAEPVLAAWIAVGWAAIPVLNGAKPVYLTVWTFRVDVKQLCGGVATILAALSMLAWLALALRSSKTRRTPIAFLRFVRFAAILAAAVALIYLFVDPAAARMPLLFALSAATFLQFAPTSRTPGARSAADMLPQRLEGDDWIATSLGSVVVAVLALGPVFLFGLPTFADPSFGFTLQLAAVLIGATSWGFGLRYVRSNLLGAIEGRPTAHEQWLDFVAPALSLLFIAAVTPMLLRLASRPSFITNDQDYITIIRAAPLYLVSTASLGLSFTVLALRLTLNDFRFFRFFMLFFLQYCRRGHILPNFSSFIYRKYSSNRWIIIFSFVSFSFLLTATAATAGYKNLDLTRLFSRVLVIAVYNFALTFFLILLFSNVFDILMTKQWLFMLPSFVVIFIPAAAAVWPILRFILTPRSLANPFNGFTEKPFAGRMRETFEAAIASAWWFVPALWLVSLRYQFFGFHVDAAPLAILVALVSGWRCGISATMPILVGSLLFVAQVNLLQNPAIAIDLPGGLWPVVVLPLLARLIGDQTLRSRILGRARAPLPDCAIFALCLGAAAPRAVLDPYLAISVDPSWLAATVGFLIGASRMRWQEPAVACAAGLVLVSAIGLHSPSFEPWALSAASFFGGRAWRSFFITSEKEDFRGIGTLIAVVVMLLATGAAFTLDIIAVSATPPFVTVRSVMPSLASMLLPALVGGMIVRKMRSAALFCWSMTVVTWAGAAYLGGGILQGNAFLDTGSTLVCFIGFSVLGYLLDRRGEADYARALGLAPQTPSRPADPKSGPGRGSTEGDVVTKPAAA